MSKRFYVTTAIPYVNARPHIGFALELVQADVIARYHRLLGDETRFQTGTDENALKNVIAAEKQGISTQEFVDRNTQSYRDLCSALGASPDRFIRTSGKEHARAVQAFWGSLNSDDIYLKPYVGLYCIGCEDFLLERDLIDGCCQDHAAPPVEVQEENYFFRLSAYQEHIERVLEADSVRVIPDSRRNEVLSFVRQGLQDISISRAAARSGGWGISVPGDSSQVIYVWFDALINYISGLGFGTISDWDWYWNGDTTKIHVIGKNVWKFHAVYWLAFLLSAGRPLPNEIVVHGFVMENGRKISKSLGNAVDPFQCVEEFGTDAVRYYLLRAVSPFEDSDFTLERLKEVYNTDLANGLGNLISRLTTLCGMAGCSGYQAGETPEIPSGYQEALSRYEFDRAFGSLWTIVDKVNREIQTIQPWRLLKTGDIAGLNAHLTNWLGQLYRLGHWLRPFLPGTAGKILHAVTQTPIVQSKAIFPRITESVQGNQE